MNNMNGYPERLRAFACVFIFITVTCVTDCGAQAEPQITANGLFIVGQNKTLACYITTAETVTGFPLTWSRGDLNLTATQEQTIVVSGKVRNYNSFYSFIVQPSDNLANYTCTANLPSGSASATWTVYVYKGPDQPLITGPSSVVAGVSNTWTCVVDGASVTAPHVYWQIGNGTRLPANTFNTVDATYRDDNNLEIHNVTSTLTLTLSAGAPSFGLTCIAVHFDTNQQTSTNMSVAVTYAPKPQMTTSGLLIVGEERALACHITTTETPSGFPLTWSRGGLNLTATQDQTEAVSGDVRNYNSFYRFTVQPSDNLAVFACTARLFCGVTSATWTAYVYKGPDTPVITGPSTTGSNVSSTWTCVVDGASGTAPTVYWLFGNGTRLSSDTFNNPNQIYQDENRLEIHNVTSTLTLTLSVGAPSFGLTCIADHHDTNQQKFSQTSVTVI